MMALIALLILMLPQGAVPKPTTLPSLVVQLVDSTWAPINQGEVTVKALSGKKESSTDHTNYDGYTKFWLAVDQEYEIEAKTTGFKTKRLKHVYLRRADDTHPLTAYVQLRLKSSERPIIVAAN